MFKRKGLTTLLLLALMLGMLPTFVFAVPEDRMGNTAYTQEDAEEGNNGNSEAAQEKKAEFKCEITSSKIDALTARYQKTFEKHKGTYMNIAERIGEVLTQLEDHGYDVDNARNAVNEFEGEVEATQTEFDGFLFQMQQAKSDLCQEGNEGEFKQSLNQSRNQLKEVRQVLLGLRSKYQEDVKPHLLELREEVRAAEDEVVPGDVSVQ